MPPILQTLVQVTLEVLVDGPGQIARISWLKYKPRFALDYVFPQGAHIRRDHGQAKTVSQKQHAALIYVGVRQHEDVGALKVHFHFVIRYVFAILNYPFTHTVTGNRLLEPAPILFTVFRPAGNDQPVIPAPSGSLGNGGNQVFEPLVRRNMAKKQNRLVAATHAQLPLCLNSRELTLRNLVVDSVWDYAYLTIRNAKLGKELVLHFPRMNEDVINEPVQDFQ